MTLAWEYRLDPGTGTLTSSIKSTPLEVNGVLYFTLPDHAWAVDARTGRQIWHYQWESQGGITSEAAASACMATGCISKRRIITSFR